MLGRGTFEVGGVFWPDGGRVVHLEREKFSELRGEGIESVGEAEVCGVLSMAAWREAVWLRRSGVLA
jgi:hypothetical protein